MDFLIEFVKNYRIIFWILILTPVLLFGIGFVKKMIRRNQKKKELARAAEDKIRDENLNSIILNQHLENEDIKEVYKPYDVDYSTPNRESNRNAKDGSEKEESHVMIQLVEKTELSTRKFMLNPVKKIHIGSDLQDNDIAVLAEGVSPRQCEIFSVRNKVYIKDLGSGKTIIKRKKESAIVDGKGVRLISNDIVILGGVSYDITIIG